jgi:ATP/maltotriose-dependent transcriptional regulator MalT
MRAEGWAAGLRLLAASLEPRLDTGDRAALLAHLQSPGRHVFEFLADEVLRRQRPDLRDFLLETSILPVPTSALARGDGSDRRSRPTGGSGAA